AGSASLSEGAGRGVTRAPPCGVVPTHESSPDPRVGLSFKEFMGGRYTRGPFDPFEQRPFEGFREIRIPRPPRRFWLGLGFVVAALLVVFLTAPIVGFITENQWYQALGLGSVYLTRVGLQALLFFVSLALAFAFTTANAV